MNATEKKATEDLRATMTDLLAVIHDVLQLDESGEGFLNLEEVHELEEIGYTIEDFIGKIGGEK